MSGTAGKHFGGTGSEVDPVDGMVKCKCVSREQVGSQIPEKVQHPPPPRKHLVIGRLAGIHGKQSMGEETTPDYLLPRTELRRVCHAGGPNTPPLIPSTQHTTPLGTAKVDRAPNDCSSHVCEEH